MRRAMISRPSSPERERANRLFKARIFNLATLAAALSVFFYSYPDPVLVAILMAVPWLAIVAVVLSHGLVRIHPEPGDTRVGVSPALILSAFGLLILTNRTVRVLQSAEELWPAVTIWLLLFMAAALTDASLRKPNFSVAWTLVVALIYAWSAGLGTNVILDWSQPVNFSATVTGKRIVVSHHRYSSSATYELQLTPWGPQESAGPVAVDQSMYKALQPGAFIRIQLHPGALGVRWYTISACAGE
jgi:hypothetical protein